MQGVRPVQQHAVWPIAVATLALALPPLLPVAWLGATVGAFGHARALRGALFVLVLVTALVLLCRSGGRRAIALALPLYLLALLLTLAETASWFMQGSSFNERFFAHFDIENVKVSVQAYPWAALGAAAALLGVAAIAFVAMGTAARRPLPRWWLLPALALLAACLLLDGPPRRLRQYVASTAHAGQLAHSDAGAQIRALIDPHPSTPANVRARPGRNLVFVYLESLERSYTDAKRFPDLVPNINRLLREGLDFSGFRTFPGATYTIAGIFASQCGAPYLLDSVFGTDIGKLGFVPGNDNTAGNTFHPQLACLGDVLHAAGYDQTYLSGVDLGFANTDSFFRMHGYDRALGAPQIEQEHHGKLKQEGWGLEDDAIFAEALSTYRTMEAAGRPFSVVLSTIDTHPPQGYTLARCGKYRAIDNAMLDAVHCSDQMLGHFIDALSHEPGWKDTVVVVMSDHVAMRNVASGLYPPDDQRQPLLFMLNAGHGERSAELYHMDIAPTVLAALDVHSNVRFLAGADRGETDSPSTALPADETAEAVLRDALWAKQSPPQLCGDSSLLRWYGRGLDIGGWQLPLMYGGFPAHDIPDDLVLLIFFDQRTAELQMLPAGDEDEWVHAALARGREVVQATPYWDAEGRALALDWRAPDGAWASLGSFHSIADVRLDSPRCRDMANALLHAPDGQRLDFSAAFGSTPIPAQESPRPGLVRADSVPAGASTTANARVLMSRIVARQTGDGPIHMSWHDRLTLYPAPNKPAWADIDVDGIDSITLEPRINTLLGQCVTRQDTGIVGFSASLDGRTVVPRLIVDRNYAGHFDIRTHGARRLHVDFDIGNGVMDCDWSVLLVPHIAGTAPAALAGQLSRR